MSREVREDSELTWHSRVSNSHFLSQGTSEIPIVASLGLVVNKRGSDQLTRFSLLFNRKRSRSLNAHSLQIRFIERNVLN